ncbi:CheR family methyltransferase [Novosphingobium album (ex Liu et al. 2023)]|uniref:Chemotaxis protein methyltransferase n=1 Tax=Novosphingobium album (ex Liu et al. 2023) TaxID=3031130 RepID=A0ABT5WX48_9SPHN|nr:protein-glutamate O-methyltransferase CheR [Novosphingobium album (ex Liu et al. 2023)]MDE8654428.1 protein-glutamate O-methyltransferase CheR [Novosphingobium album (ex Liu et al. 2023)]
MSRAAALSQSIPGVSPEIYCQADFEAVARIVHDNVGIVLPQGKALLVYSRLAPLVRESGCVTFGNFVERMRADEAELNRAMAALTTNHTFFYREAHHFEHFEHELRPDLIARLKAHQPVRLWSAGCSSGEEVWSLVMTMLGPDRAAGQALARADLRVLASDVAPHAIRRAEEAVYPAKDLKPVPDALRRAWTSESDGTAAIGETMRAIVRFRMLNLLGEWPISGKFDVIFCRNVMIYFDNPTKERLVQRFLDALTPDGFLYIGHSERVSGPASRQLQLVGPTIYRRRNA